MRTCNGPVAPRPAARWVCLFVSVWLVFPFPRPKTHAQEACYFRILGPGATIINGVTPDGYVTWTNALTNVTCTVQTAQSLTSPSNWADYVQVPVGGHIVTQRVFDLHPPPGMALIPAGSFTMGDPFNDSPDPLNGRPLHTVYVSAFYMDRHEVTKALWDDVYTWAIAQGYSFEYVADGKAANHPAEFMTWYEAVKWCNARSEKEGRTPAYYLNVAQTTVYRGGEINISNAWVKWNTGYRLPTEAEWEKAARGGAGGRRFPWSDTDSIAHSLANYYVSRQNGTNSHVYDTSVTSDYHPTFNDNVQPYTSPVGYFAANGYGLYDMAGNIREWCWDWRDRNYYSNNPSIDPRGPDSGSGRVHRGGSWEDNAFQCRTANQASVGPTIRFHGYGFRCVLPPVEAGANHVL